MTVLIAIIASLAAVVIGAFLVVVYRVSRTGGVSIAGYRISRAASGPEALPAGLQLVIDAIPAVVSCKDRDGRIVLINAYSAALFGASPAEILGGASTNSSTGRSSPGPSRSIARLRTYGDFAGSMRVIVEDLDHCTKEKR